VLLDAFWDWTILKILMESERTDVMAVTMLMRFDGAVTGVIVGAVLVETVGGGVGVKVSGVGAAMYT
jgi:hypothetical protein